MFPLATLQVHKWVNVESMMKACLVGPLVTAVGKTTTTSSSTGQPQNTNSTVGRSTRTNTLNVPKPLMIIDGEGIRMIMQDRCYTP